MAIFQPMEGAVEPGRRACFWSPSFQFQTLMKIPDHWRDPGIFGGSVTLMLLSLRFMHFFDNMVHYPWDAWEVQAFSTRKTYHVENKHPFYPEVVEVYICISSSFWSSWVRTPSVEVKGMSNHSTNVLVEQTWDSSSQGIRPKDCEIGIHLGHEQFWINPFGLNWLDCPKHVQKVNDSAGHI